MTKNKKETEILRQFDPSIDLDIRNLPKPWTEKQYHFALAYLANGFNATQAAISAGYSEKSAKQHSHNIMTKHDFKHVQDYIAHRQTKVLNKWAFDHDRHIEQLSKMAYFDMKDFAKIDPNTGNFSIDWQKFFDMGYGACVDDIETSTLSIKTVEGGEEILMPVLNSKVKMSKRKDALEMLNKINKLYQSVGDSEDNPMFVKFINDIPK